MEIVKGLKANALGEVSLSDLLKFYDSDAFNKLTAVELVTFNNVAKSLIGYVASSARGERRRRINSKANNLYTLSPCGIFERLVYDTKAGKSSYCAGQSYPDEMATMRDLLDYKS